MARNPVSRCIPSPAGCLRRGALALTLLLAASVSTGPADAAPVEKAALATVELVADTDTRDIAVSSAPYGFTAVGDRVFFGANDGLAGSELWVSDGTQEGTELAFDFVAGRGGAIPQQLVAFGDQLLFSPLTGKFAGEPWITDGTVEGTRLLADISPGSWPGGAGGTVIGDHAYFAGSDLVDGSDPWVTDGTAEGTFRLAEIDPTVAIYAVGPFAGVAGSVVFATGLGDLWRTDGSVAGTNLLTSRFRGGNGQHVALAQQFVAQGGYLYFDANDPASGKGHELWRTNGNTVELVADVLAGAGSSFPKVLFSFGGRVWFETADGCTDSIQLPPPSRCLWSDDGNPTTPPQRVSFGYGGVKGWTINAATDVLYLALDDDTVRSVDLAGRVVDLLSPPIIDPPIGNQTMSFQFVPLLDGAAVAVNGYGGRLLRLETQQSPFPAFPIVVELIEEPLDYVFELAAPSFGRLMASARSSGDDETELWVSDGSVAGTRKIEIAADVASGNPQILGLGAGGTLTWNGIDGEGHGLQNIFVVERDGPMVGFDDFGGVIEAVFLDDVSVYAAVEVCELCGFPEPIFGLWRREGDQLVLLRSFDAMPRELTVAGPLNQKRIFFATDEPTGQKLWVTDGTPEGTVVVRDLYPDYQAPVLFPGPPPATYPRHLVAVGERLAMIGYNSEFNFHGPWFSDGTFAGTFGPYGGLGLGSSFRDLYALGNIVLADVVFGPAPGTRELWSTADSFWRIAAPTGTPDGPALPLAVRGNEAFFLAPNALAAGPVDHGDWLWRTDGTIGGTFPLTAFPGAHNVGQEIVTGGSRLFLVISDANDNRQLWTSDGTAAGTTRVALSGGDRASPEWLAGTPDGLVIFAASDPQHGHELWQSDGSPAGTVRLSDLAPGEASSSPGPFTIGTGEQGERVAYFAAFDPAHGRELFVTSVEPLAPTVCVADDDTLCLRGGRFVVEASFTDPRSPLTVLQPAHASPLSGESGLFWFFDPANPELQVKVLDGTGINGHFWVFVSSLTSVPVELRVTDTQTGERKVYGPLASSLCGIADTSAFAATDGVSTSAVTQPALTLPSFSSGARPAGVASPSLTPPYVCRGTAGGECIGIGGYAIAASWRNPHTGAHGVGVPIQLNDVAGGFSFFDGTNLEVLVKVLPAHAINGHSWLFYGTMTDLEVELEVYDGGFGTHQATLTRPAGSLCGGALFDLP